MDRAELELSKKQKVKSFFQCKLSVVFDCHVEHVRVRTPRAVICNNAVISTLSTTTRDCSRRTHNVKGIIAKWDNYSVLLRKAARNLSFQKMTAR